MSHGYRGIEFRGIQREMDLTKTREFSTRAAREATLARMADLSLNIVGFGTSTKLHVKEPVARERELDEARRFVDLAAEVRCPYVRVFPDKLPDGREKAETLELIASGLNQLADYAKATGVQVLLETHGDLVYIADILHVMELVGRKEAGLIWDVFNMWIVTGENPVRAYGKLAPYIRHVHLKDGRKADGKIGYSLMGQGSAPLRAAIRALKGGGYSGFYSFEWEKLWHPELPDPEVALAGFPAFMRRIT